MMELQLSNNDFDRLTFFVTKFATIVANFVTIWLRPNESYRSTARWASHCESKAISRQAHRGQVTGGSGCTITNTRS